MTVQRLATSVAVMILGGIATLPAQSTLVGVVRDSTGAGIPGATVAVAALNRSTQTDDKGAFTLANVLPGMRMVSVRRVGFSPFTKLTAIAEGINELPPVVLGRVVVRLDTVVTEEQMLWREAPLLREFEDNRKIGLGKFFTRADLEKARGRSMMSFFESMPGLIALTLRGGRWIKSNRGITSLDATCYELEDLLENPKGRNCGCFPLVYLDFQPLSVAERVPNINRFRPDELEAMEVYRNAAQTPSRYSGLGSHCGVIVLHSRRPLGKKDK